MQLERLVRIHPLSAIACNARRGDDVDASRVSARRTLLPIRVCQGLIVQLISRDRTRPVLCVAPADFWHIRYHRIRLDDFIEIGPGRAGAGHIHRLPFILLHAVDQG